MSGRVLGAYDRHHYATLIKGWRAAELEGRAYLARRLAAPAYYFSRNPVLRVEDLKRSERAIKRAHDSARYIRALAHGVRP